MRLAIRNLKKVGGWMKYKKGSTLIETIIYVFAVTIILSETVNLSISMYKCYLNSRYLTVRYNDIQNFYLSLDDIKNKKENVDIQVNDDKVIFLKVEDEKKEIKINDSDKLVVNSYKRNMFQSSNTIIDGINSMKVKQKGNLIYIIVCDKEERKFVACI